MSEPGHVFVVQGDLLQIHADDVLVPCDTSLNVTSGWKSVLGSTEPGDEDWVRPVGVTAPEGFGGPERPPVKLSDLPDGRRVWLVNSGGPPTEIKWLVSGVRNAVAWVAKGGGGDEARHGRDRQLIAMPVFGVGAGGFAGQRGAVLDGILDALGDAVRAPGSPDIVLVLNHRADYAAVQSRRREHLQPREGIGPLRDLARRSGLVLFIGAGASAGAGFPTWTALLARLAEKTQLSEEVRAAVLKLPAPDAADVIGSEVGNLQDLIAEIFTQDGYALTHALLASLRVHEAVTTNYDTLYENAATLPHGTRLKVLPRERRSAEEPWLLKLHGDIKLKDSIVLTREQYLRFDADSVPLASVVQSSMVTKHVLFVGYSLSDENFIRLARQVRQLFRAVKTVGPVGTVLTLFDDPARDRLWHGDLQFIPMAPAFVPPPGSDGRIPDAVVAAAARKLEIFLDELAAASCDDAPYVVNERYRELVSPEDRILANALQKLVEVADSTGRGADTPAWRKARDLLRELGWAPGSRG